MPTAIEQHPLRPFLYPRAIAVIGASSEARKAGGRRWLSLIQEGYEGQIYPVTKRAGELDGYRTFQSIHELPSPADLAIIMVPTPAVLDTVRQCAHAGVKAVVVISAGFGEIGTEGKKLEAEMTAVLRGAGARMLGPNSAGVFSGGGGVNCLGWKTPPGRIAVITQSGNMAVTFTQYAKAKAAGFASVIAIGNSADLKLSEVVELVQEDEQTSSILIYCEGFSDGDGRRLIEVVEASRKVPIVMLKPGVSEAGRIAAKSHTGSLTGEDVVVSAALAEAGIIRAGETEEAFDMALALASCVPPRGRRVVVLSDGGGHATIVSDCAGRYGLELAELSDAARKQLRMVLPDRAAIANPIDFAGFAESDPDSIARAVEICLNDSGVGGAIFAGHFGGYHLMTDHAETQERISSLEVRAAGDMMEAARRSGKPLILHSDHGERDLVTFAPIRSAGVPIYSSLESAAKAMAALSAWGVTHERYAGREPRPRDLAQYVEISPQPKLQRALTEPEARDRLSAFGITVPEYVLAASEMEAVGALRRFGTSLAMKLIAPSLIHKSDVGGVILGVATADEVEASFRRLKELAVTLGNASSPVLITPMIDAGVECIVGAKRDPQFGPIVVFGAGGILVELIEDVTIRLAPTSVAAARSAVESSVVGRLLRGFRGAPPADCERLAELLVSVSQFIASTPDVQEIDLNPVIANEHGAFIADARLIAA